jgi:3-dehydroquinate dehydratase
VSLVCVPITVHDLAPALADAHAARDGGADLVEFRIDECFSGSGDEG